MTLRKVGERTVLEVGVDLLDDRVGAVGLLGLDEGQRGNPSRRDPARLLLTPRDC